MLRAGLHSTGFFHTWPLVLPNVVLPNAAKYSLFKLHYFKLHYPKLHLKRSLSGSFSEHTCRNLSSPLTPRGIALAFRLGFATILMLTRVLHLARAPGPLWHRPQLLLLCLC